MAQKVWTLIDFKKVTKQKTNDQTNCGIYCVKYLEKLINSDLALTFTNTKSALSGYRQEMHEILTATQ